MVPINNALNMMRERILLDFKKYVKDVFNCPIYSVNLIGSTLFCTIAVCLNLKDKMVAIVQQIKHNTIGIYPLITNVNPAIAEAMASNI